MGGFSYSEGLEGAVDSGRVTDETQAGDWLCDQLGLTLGRSDLPVLWRAIGAWQRGDHRHAAALALLWMVLVAAAAWAKREIG